MYIKIDDLTSKEIAIFLAEHISEMKSVSPPKSKLAHNLDGLKKARSNFLVSMGR